ncbi:MAG: J domain-containing protein [Xenococcaceae cyanobacterium MO_207.B15]|nr:J domain-containing protein [Xenococcaceae cyanobacterium MO_207.B15]MDJ0741906.1 J domain-containing protein [Xenococcaceae cyanobacterium MO_167.B27]
MTNNSTANQTTTTSIPESVKLADTYYGILGLHPSVSMIDIRRRYRQLSKKYHPDTTELPQVQAKAKFQRLNEAYGTLSNPERRSLYDLKIGYSRLNVIQAPKGWEQPGQETSYRTAYLDPTDRPLSSGEIFVLFLLGATFVGCILLVLTVAYFRGETLILIYP